MSKFIHLFVAWLCSSVFQLWDVDKGVAHSHFHGHTQAVASCTFSPDMRLVATGSADKTVKLFDLHNQTCLQTFYQNTGEVTCVKFHPFGNVLATGCADNSIKLWDIRNNQLLQHYSAHDLGVTCIDFHPSGNYLLSSSLDSSIRLWDLRQGHQLYTIHGHPSPVNSCAFTYDGHSFVTGGDDQRVITWNTHLDNDNAKTHRGLDKISFGAPLPKVGLTPEPQPKQQRGALLASQIRAAPTNTGALGRNCLPQGKRDAYYESHGLINGPEFIPPQPSGPLPPTEIAPNLPSRGRVIPPPYTFQTGAHAGQTVGPGSLYIGDTYANGQGPLDSTAHHCDYTHTHASLTTGQIHSYADQHSDHLASRAAEAKQQYEERKSASPTMQEGLEGQSLEEQLQGFVIPGLSFPSETGIALTRSGEPGPSHLATARSQPATARTAEDGSHTARSHVSMANGPPSFAASAAGVQPSIITPRVTRGNAPTTADVNRSRDDFVYSYQSDRFVSSHSHPGQAQTSEVVALKNTPGVDIFAIPPADHIQRLPEQLAHTLKYMVTQLDQVTRVTTNTKQQQEQYYCTLSLYNELLTLLSFLSPFFLSLIAAR